MALADRNVVEREDEEVEQVATEDVGDAEIDRANRTAARETTISGNDVVMAMKRLPTNASPNPVWRASSAPSRGSQSAAPTTNTAAPTYCRAAFRIGSLRSVAPRQPPASRARGVAARG